MEQRRLEFHDARAPPPRRQVDTNRLAFCVSNLALEMRANTKTISSKISGTKTQRMSRDASPTGAELSCLDGKAGEEASTESKDLPYLVWMPGIRTKKGLIVSDGNGSLSAALQRHDQRTKRASQVCLKHQRTPDRHQRESDRTCQLLARNIFDHEATLE